MSLGLSCEDTPDKDQWRLKLKGELAKWCVCFGLRMSSNFKSALVSYYILIVNLMLY